MKFKIKETYLLLIIVMGLVSLSVYSTYALFTASTTITDVVSFNATLNTDNNLIEYEMITLSPGEVKMVEINVNNTYSTSLYYGTWYQIVSPSDTTDIVVGLTDDNTSSGSGVLTKTSSIKLIVGLANNSSKTAIINIGTIGSTTSNLNLPTGRNLIPEEFYVEPNPNSPNLVEGLIPVSYNETTLKWVKADFTNKNNSWYNYKEKKWANAVLVTDTNRSAYQSAAVGTTITDSDILAFYVWIPRYKYKVWNKDKVIGTDSYNARTTGIDIVFESDTESTGTIVCNDYSFAEPSSEAGSPNETCTGINGDYYTHPAFTFGDNEIRGFWIGKFEINGYISKMTILPGEKSYVNKTISEFSTMIQNMQKSSNIYGLSVDKVVIDSHMIKNMEWGAVAYLTNSNYGRCFEGSCIEISTNDCNTYVTGMSGNDCSTKSNEYNGTIGVLASTTGNIYGVYDMSGGALEYVMGNMSGTSGRYALATGDESAFSTSWYNTQSNQKYLDVYAKGGSYDDQKAYNRGKLGDATGEIVLSTDDLGGWYNDCAKFPAYSNRWFYRGGRALSNDAGIFHFDKGAGNAYSSFSTRAILVSLN